ncbi:MAG: hypothetical protein U0168_14865 [Nannocystaceae bacterium]
MIEPVAHAACVGDPLPRIGLPAAIDQIDERSRQIRSQLSDRLVGLELARHHLCRVARLVGREATQQLVHRDAQGVDVEARRGRRARELFGRHVQPRAGTLVDGGEPLAGGFDLRREAEVHQLRDLVGCARVRDQHVLGLHVAVDHARVVHRDQRVGEVARQPTGAPHRQHPFHRQQIAQRRAAHELGHQHHAPVGQVSALERPHQVRVVADAVHELALVAQPLLGLGFAGVLGRDDLERDLAKLGAAIARQVHRRHAAATAHALDLEAIGDDRAALELAGLGRAQAQVRAFVVVGHGADPFDAACLGPSLPMRSTWVRPSSNAIDPPLRHDSLGVSRHLIAWVPEFTRTSALGSTTTVLVPICTSA